MRAAQAVRDGQASAMVSAGNTGAAMASALLRMGRIKGVSRPAIATPIPRLSSGPVVLLDAGANADCEPEWLVQFGLMGAVFARHRFGVDEPRVGLLSIGEEAGKGNSFVKETFAAMSAVDWAGTCGARFIGNVEGRDLMGEIADVAVTDGFTGNVALKAMEGTTKTVIKALLEAFDATPEARAAAESLLPALLPLYAKFSPETYGGAMLLGVDGVCIISHGSSNANAIRNALGVAHDMVTADVVHHLRRGRRRLSTRAPGPSRSPPARRSRPPWRSRGHSVPATPQEASCPRKRMSAKVPSTVPRSSRSSRTGSPTSSRSTRGRSTRATRSVTTSMPTLSR